MLFHEPLFLFYVLPAFLLLFWATKRRPALRPAVLVGQGLLFYAWGEPVFAGLLCASMIVDYGLSKAMDGREGLVRRVLLTAGIVQNLGILIAYKYLGFFVGLLAPLGFPAFGTVSVPALALPIGVSFVVFEKISYLVDVYRRTTPPAKALADFSIFVLFFPKVLAGPIVKYHEIDRQIRDLRFPSADDLTSGLIRFAIGASKKLLIADPLANIVDPVFRMPAAEVGFAAAWLAILAFTMQIYFDFSGYSDMAIGLGRAFGFRLRENFATPYLAASMTDFWRRWHMSMTTWVKDYLYVPLGGNKGSALRTAVNLWICFLLSGLWHGANWTFVVWGAYNGLLLSLDRLFLRRWLAALPQAAATTLTFLFVMIGWVFFRSTGLDQALVLLSAMFRPGTGGAPFAPAASSVAVLLVALGLCVAPALARWENPSPALRRIAAVGLALIVVLALARSVAASFQPFLYFRF